MYLGKLGEQDPTLIWSMFLDFSEQLVSFMDVSCACRSRSRVWFFFINFVFVNLCLMKLD